MKSDTTLTRKVCVAIAGALLIVAGAVAFVAVKTPTSQAKTSVSQFRAFRRDPFETSLGRLSRSGDPEANRIHNGRSGGL